MYLFKDHVIRPKFGTRGLSLYKKALARINKDKYTIPDEYGGGNAALIRSTICDAEEELEDFLIILELGKYWKYGLHNNRLNLFQKICFHAIILSGKFALWILRLLAPIFPKSWLMDNKYPASRFGDN